MLAKYVDQNKMLGVKHIEDPRLFLTNLKNHQIDKADLMPFAGTNEPVSIILYLDQNAYAIYFENRMLEFKPASQIDPLDLEDRILVYEANMAVKNTTVSRTEKEISVKTPKKEYTVNFPFQLYNILSWLGQGLADYEVYSKVISILTPTEKETLIELLEAAMDQGVDDLAQDLVQYGLETSFDNVTDMFYAL